jgi:Transposase family tnp2
VFCSVVIDVSRNDGDFILGLINIILYLAFADPAGVLAPKHEDVIAQMPQSIQEALSKFNLDSRTTTYAVCPACHCTYKPRFSKGSLVPIYDDICRNRPTPESDLCMKPLLRKSNDTGSPKPIKPFVYHHFHDFVGNLLSRADLEEAMDKACDDLKNDLSKPPPEFVSDIWQAEFLRTFEGPMPGTLFIDRQEEGRLGFTFNVDFFAVEGMRIRGARTSCGLISMACLNLPYDIRYKPENMYVAGLIPGPHEPSLTELNHYIKPVIDDLVVSWKCGVSYSRTALHPSGRTIRCAIIAAVMDLVAARKTSQLAPVTSHFYCSVCQCYHQDTLGRTDHQNWEFRDSEEMRRHAEQWKEATTLKDQNDIFTTHGTRWSEMWRLPYWNPTRQLVVDAMHCVLEGVAHHHFRIALGLTSVSAASKPEVVRAFSHRFTKVDSEQLPLPDDMSVKEAKSLTGIHSLLTAALAGVDDDGNVIDQEEFDASIASFSKRLSNKNMKPLRFVARDVNCAPTSLGRIYKKQWVDALVSWVCLYLL